jgi:hypothetical protein
VRAPRDNSSEDIKRQLVNLESKIDYILELLAIGVATIEDVVAEPAASEEAVPAKVRKPKTVKTKTQTKEKAPAKKKVAKKSTKAK